MAVRNNNVIEGQLADALSTIQDVIGNLRRLQTVQDCPEGKVDLEDPHNIAQIVQGAGFIALAMWLIFANNSKVAVAQKAPLEQRHAVCATISTAVALFSGFFNILQLTAIDDFDLPGRASAFSLNLSRPVEWIATCPIMQLKLVVLAGARVPSYRRFMMPLLSVAVLLCGTASMFTGDALRFGWYGFGLCLASIMFYHNILQIRENSEGEEGAFVGDSDFRKLSLLLILTWIPFPLWFSLSIEGFGVIKDTLIIEMGWVILNIVSKFTFIIWMQRMKMVHQRKLEAARELYGLSPTDEVPEDELKAKANNKKASAAGGVNASTYGLGYGEEADSEEKMVEIVAETMVTLGMSTHTDRFLKLMVENGVTNTAVLERLNAERCMELNLPWVLIEASQKRWTSEKMSLGQDQGGVILKEDPFKKLLEANKERMTGKGLMQSLPGMNSGASPTNAPYIGGINMLMADHMEQMREIMGEVLMPFQDAIMEKLHGMEETLQRQMEQSQEAIAQRMDFSQVAILQTGGGVAVTSPLKFKLSALGYGIHLGIKSYIETEEPLVLQREDKWIVAWERDENQPLVSMEKDVVANYELMREVLVAVHNEDNRAWSNGIPPLGDFQGALVYTTALMNYHSELYKCRGGKGRIRDWGHRESNRLRACFSHLHRLALKTDESRTPMLRVLKKLYLTLRNASGDAGALPVVQDPDADPAAQEQLDVEDLDDEPIILKEIVAPTQHLQIKDEDPAPIAVDDSQAEDDINGHPLDGNQALFESYCDEYMECSQVAPEPADDDFTSMGAGVTATLRDQAETLEYSIADATAGTMPSKEEPIPSSSAGTSVEDIKQPEMNAEMEVTEPAEPGLAEQQAALRKALKKKAKQDELDKTALKEQKAKEKQDAADVKENKRLARQTAAEEKAKKKEEKKEWKNKGKHVSEPSMGSVTTTANDGTSANNADDATEPKRKRLRKVQNEDPLQESGEHEGVPKTSPAPKQLKVVENFELLKLTGISELHPELGDKKSFTVRPGDDVMAGARGIGVILATASFYVNKSMLATDDWPPSLRMLYKADVKEGVTIPWHKNGAGEPVSMVQCAWTHAMILAGWVKASHEPGL